MTRTAGSRPSRRCGSAARRTRTALHSVPSSAFCQAASSRSSNRPGGGPPELTTSRSSPPNASTAADTAAAGPSAVDRSAGTARASSRAASASSRSPPREIRPTWAPSARRIVAIAPPRPPLPPPMSARAPSSPRSIGVMVAGRVHRPSGLARSGAGAGARLWLVEPRRIDLDDDRPRDVAGLEGSSRRYLPGGQRSIASLRLSSAIATMVKWLGQSDAGETTSRASFAPSVVRNTPIPVTR